MPLAIGDRLGPYELRGPLGAGGMGVVYRAYDTRLQRSVAIKVLSESISSEVYRARLEREARAVAALSHPNVVSVFDVGTHDERFYVVSELLEGETLRGVMRNGPMTPSVAVDYARQAAAGLQAAHAKGIVHRDIKPENLFVTTDGRLKVLDFGLVALMSEPDSATAVHANRLTAPDTVLGTIGYMSPEQLRGEQVDVRTDIFSLGCVLFEMLAGRPPFLRGSQTATVAAILNDPPDYAPLTNTPLPLVRVVQRCLEKGRNDRYASAEQLSGELLAPSDVPTVAFASQERKRGGSTLSRAALAGLVIAAAVTATLMLPRPGETETPSPIQSQRAMVAVLPFENLSGDPAQEYFSDGLTEDTTSEFGRLSPERLGVIARTSVMRYKKTRADIRTIGRELGVDYVVEGSVRRAGDRVRVAAQLVRASDGTHLWAETYDRTVDDVFALQSELARDVAGAVEIKLAPPLAASARRTVPMSAAGRDAFLRGRYHLALGTPADRQKAVAYMEQASLTDPGSAQVHTEMARAFLSMSTIDVPPHQIVPKAREAVTRALELDDSLAEAHDVLGTMLLEYYWDWAEAEREMKRAIALSPNLARAHATYATLLVSSGRMDEGIQHAARARELDPLALSQHRNFLIQLIAARRWSDALEQAQKVIRLEPQYDLAYAIEGLARLKLGDTEGALASAGKVVAMTKVPVPRAWAAYVYAHSGRTAEARSLLQELQAAAEKRFVCFFNVATLHGVLGEKEKAFEDLERAIRDRSG